MLNPGQRRAILLVSYILLVRNRNRLILCFSGLNDWFLILIRLIHSELISNVIKCSVVSQLEFKIFFLQLYGTLLYTLNITRSQSQPVNTVFFRFKWLISYFNMINSFRINCSYMKHPNCSRSRHATHFLQHFQCLGTVFCFSISNSFPNAFKC